MADDEWKGSGKKGKPRRPQQQQQQQPQQQQQQQQQPQQQQQQRQSQQRQAPQQTPPRQAATPPQAAAWGRQTSRILTEEISPEVSQPRTSTITAQAEAEPGITQLPKSTEKPTIKPSPQKPEQAEREQRSEIRSVEETFQQLQIGGLVADLHGFPVKPKVRCNLGTDIRLLANHYAFRLGKPFLVFHYDINIYAIRLDQNNIETQREVNTREVAKNVFKELYKRYPAHKDVLFYDYRKSLYSISEFPSPLEIRLQLPELNDRQYLVKIKKVNEIKVDVNQVLDQVVLQILQLIFTNNLSLRYVTIIRSFFSNEFERKSLGFNVDLWRGFYASVRPSQLGFNLNVDVANTVFFNATDMIDLACKCYECNPNDLYNAFQRDRGNAFTKIISGRKVRTRLNFTKKVEKLGPTALEHRFKVGNTEMTINEYFKKQGIILKYPNLPCLCLGRDNYTPMELCKTELTNIKKLEPRETSEMIRATAVPCYQRRNDINNMLKISQPQIDPILKNYNIELKLSMVQIMGKVLSAPDLEYGGDLKMKNKFTLSNEIGSKGQWDNANKLFYEPRELNSWVAINCGRSIRENALNDFINALIQMGTRHGIRIRDPLDYVNGDSRFNEQRALDMFTKLTEQFKNIQFFLVILSGTSRIYNALKTFGDIQKGIITQAIDENSITKQRGRYDRLVSNICLKINSKLGGKNFKLFPGNSLFVKHLQNLYDGPLMIFGADVNHPSPVDKDITESIAALVGSIDKDCCYYAARLQAQQQPKGKPLELILDLRLMVKELLEEHYKALGAFPKRIVFLRDGVSEGQFKDTRNHEMNEIRTACQTILSGYKPAVTFVIVQKGHHTRLFPFDKKDEAGKAGNVPPGTLVDNQIVSPDLFDFFLCSHMGIQGTSRPCHYYVLHDENEFTMDRITLLCHYLCHIYSRSTTSVSYPAPTYYADLCAARGREYIRRRTTALPTQSISSPIEIHPILRNKMFFI